jgi:hypothetical protein
MDAKMGLAQLVPPTSQNYNIWVQGTLKWVDDTHAIH